MTKSSNLVLREDRDGVATLSLNRPPVASMMRISR